MSNILVTGSANGLGAEIVLALRTSGHHVFEYDIAHGCSVTHPVWSQREIPDELDVLVNNAGVNKIAWLENMTESDWDRVMDVNAKGIFKMTKACLPQLKASRGTIVNIVSNAAHIPMTCSLAYNASKAAAHMMTLQLARELTKAYGITVFGIAPNKMAGTQMSRYIEEETPKMRGWTVEEAAAYQQKSLLAGETPPEHVADFLAYLLMTKEHHRYLSGCVLPYGA